jgi:hypothetical protein
MTVDQQRGHDSAGIEPQISRVALLASLQIHQQ